MDTGAAHYNIWKLEQGKRPVIRQDMTGFLGRAQEQAEFLTRGSGVPHEAVAQGSERDKELQAMRVNWKA